MGKHRTTSHARGPADRHTGANRSLDITPHTEVGLERIMFFSDAVIAIAITLLALEIRLPEQGVETANLAAALVELSPRYLSFFISFFVIGLFWISHHRLFEYVHTYTRGLIWINLVFLFLVAFVPFPTAVLGRFPAELPSVVFYAIVIIGLSLARIWLWWYVYYRAHLIRPDTNPRAGRYEFLRAVSTASVFGISILIAYWDPNLAMLSWLALVPLSFVTRTLV
jgi:uncharacterized membrane protein